ncbi:DUF4434 domain-containing protein [Deefgea rivuli]|uniref:DUF4434 domain-containing protein n=1 Tax=Deefgea rivuli TaxID=400948 RepID=UPI000487981C|nr:DUF4434 domain-containing protein [Deefgea rivuli]
MNSLICLAQIAAVFAAICGANIVAAHDRSCAPARQKIIVYQPWASHSAVNPAQAKVIAKQLNTYGFTHLLLQWSRYGEQRYWLDDKPSWLPKQIKLGARQIIEGLYFDPGYYQALSLPDTSFEIYLATLRENSLIEAHLLQQNTQGKIDGWYFPEEIDDLNWRTQKRQEMLSAHFKSMIHGLKRLNANAPIYASTFFGGHSSPQEYARMLKKIHQETGIIWLVQDGLGVLRQPQPNTRQYLRTMSRTLPTNAWLGLLETFTELNQTGENRFCPASRSEIESRRKLWCSATGREPEVYFSLNQFNNKLLGHQNIKCKTRDGHFAAI